MHGYPDTSGFDERSAYRLQRQFVALEDDASWSAWSHMIQSHWPGWRDWYVARGQSGAATPGEADRALRRHMPELVGLVDRLSAEGPHDPVFREFLTFWCPPRYLVSCTQAASQDAFGPLLIRNYDLDPALNELTLLKSAWRGKSVMGMVEGLLGLSDGINENGLAASLSFGGRVVSGRGFGIPILIRYVLETCTDVQDALEALRAVPCHMSYNVTLTDRQGAAATVFLGPDRPAMVSHTTWATNHQLGVEWPRHGRMSATIERAQALHALFASGPPDEYALRGTFLAPPFFSSRYRQGYGTVFSAIYRPQAETVRLFWQDGGLYDWHLGAFQSDTVTVTYSEAGSRAEHRSGTFNSRNLQ